MTAPTVMLARTAMMAITTNNSISVKAPRRLRVRMVRASSVGRVRQLGPGEVGQVIACGRVGAAGLRRPDAAARAELQVGPGGNDLERVGVGVLRRRPAAPTRPH